MNSSAMMSPTISTRRVAKPSMNEDSGRSVMSENPARRANQVVDDRIGRQRGARLPLFGRPVTGPHENAAPADHPTQLDVEPPIADHVRAAWIDAEFLGGPVHEPPPWLPALAAPRISLDTP